jgi:hypothetical protein
MLLYGVAYAVASLSCTIGPFLAITTTTFRSQSVLSGLAVFVLYGIGMGLVVGLLAVAVALARSGFVARFRRALPYVSRVSGGLLVLAGVYVAYYGWFEIRVFAGGSAQDPVVDAFTSVQGAISAWVAGLSPAVIVGSLAALAAVAVTAWWAHRRRSTDSEASRTMAG